LSLLLLLLTFITSQKGYVNIFDVFSDFLCQIEQFSV
jgi:hypothetical protein